MRAIEYAIALTLVLPTASAAAEEVLEEIVVTAQKREQNLSDVPIPITALSGDSLEASGVVDFQSVGRQIPGATFAHSFSVANSIMTIRGLASAGGGESTTSYYIDDFAYGSPGLGLAPSPNLFDLERVEVARGPQGTLWGASAMGGLVRLVTGEPDSTSGFGGKLQATGSTYEDGENSFSGDFAMNLPLIENELAARIVGSYRETGGFIDRPLEDDANGFKHKHARAKVLYTPANNERLAARFSYWYSEDKEPGGYFLDPPAKDRSASSSFALFETEQTIYNFAFDYDFTRVSLEASVAYGEWEQLQRFSSSFFFAETPWTVDTTTTEIRLLSSSDSQWRWIGGVFYRESDQVAPLVFDVFGLFETDDFGTVDTQEWALFGELTYESTDGRWEMTAGVRYSEEDRDFTSDVTQVGLLPFIPSFQTFEERSETFQTVNPRFNVTFRPSNEFMLYTNIAKGYRPGRVNYAGPVASAEFAGIFGTDLVKEDIVWTYEVGLKSTLLDGAVFLEASVFYSDWQDAQWVVGLPTGVGVQANVGNVEIVGFDFGLSYQTPIEGLSLTINGNFTDPEWADVFDAAVTAVNPNIDEGSKLPAIPEISGNLNVNYTTPISAHWNFVANADFYYRDKQKDIYGRSVFTSAQKILGLRIGVESESWDVFLYGKNVTDHDKTAVYTNNLPTVLPPRELGIRCAYRF